MRLSGKTLACNCCGPNCWAGYLMDEFNDRFVDEGCVDMHVDLSVEPEDVDSEAHGYYDDHWGAASDDHAGISSFT